MKVLLLLGKYLPEKNGGIENYSHWLASLLLQNNYEVNVAVLETPGMQPYVYENVQVLPLKNGLDSFTKLLKEGQYNVCHIHEYSGENGINLNWFIAAKQHCEKIFFTFHLPYLTCYKGDFRFLGLEDCNHFTSANRCLKCVIATKLNYKSDTGGLKRLPVNLLMPLLMRTTKSRRTKKRIAIQKEHLAQLITHCDAIFIYAGWFKVMLQNNGYNAPTIYKIPYLPKPNVQQGTDYSKGIKNRLLFVGRIEEQKGLHLLCKAMKTLSSDEIQLDVFGNRVDEAYFQNCKSLYEFNYKNTVPLNNLLTLLPDYDFLVLPSLFTEMYSMMVKYAGYANMPVIASGAKGNKDVIINNVNGFLFGYDDWHDLTRVIKDAYKLKQAGWTPQFETGPSNEEIEKEILSYYS